MIKTTSVSTKTQEILQRALAIASQCRAETLNSAHLLLALLESDCGDQIRAEVGQQFHAAADELAHALSQSLGCDLAALDSISSGWITAVPFSPEVNAILVAAKRQADRQGSEIHPTHIRDAIGSVPNGPAANLLRVLRKGPVDELAIDKLGAGELGAGELGTGELGTDDEWIDDEWTDEPSQPTTAVNPAETESKSANLLRYCRDLIALAKAGELMPLIARERETRQVIESLGRMFKNNPVLVGGAGVGKTAIVEGLAQRIAAGLVPAYLQDSRVWSLDVASLVAGASMRGEFEQRLRGILDELQRSPKNILFVDEIHVLLSPGSAGGALDAAAVLKPLLARGAIRFIGATTSEDYRAIERDRALERRFDRIWVDEPNRETTLAIVQGVTPGIEKHHRLKIEDSAVQAAVDLTTRYLPERLQPDKAIDVIDQAAAAYRARHGVSPWAHTHRLASTASGSPCIGAADIRGQIAARTGIPVELVGNDSQRLVELEAHLRRHVVGQEEALVAVAAAVRRSRCGLSAPHRPLGSFLFAGPVGVGKTLVAQTLAEFLFGRADAITIIDMGEYSEPHSIARLIGSPPGYVAHQDGGQLTEKVRRRPYQVLLLDEIDKAHPAVQQLLLGVLEGGRLTDGTGRTVDFSNTIIIMTANTLLHDPVGFGVQDSSDTIDLGQQFIPELLNRLDRIVPFRKLGDADARQVAQKEIAKLSQRLANRQITLTATDAALTRLASRFDNNLGARPIRNLVEQSLADLIAQALLAGEVHEEDTIVIDIDHDKLTIRATMNETNDPKVGSG